MSRREKIIAAAVGLFVAVLMVYLVAFKFFISPVLAARAEAAKIAGDIRKLQAEKRLEDVYGTRLRELARMTFGADELHVSKEVGNYMVELLNRSGLGDVNQTIRPVTGARVPGAYKEVGWNIRTRGKLKNVVDFLYLLEAEPRLRRVNNLTVVPQRGSRDLELQLKYTTLILERRKGEQLPAARPAGEVLRLDTAERKQYAMIEGRDLFRPYIKAPPPAPAPPEPPHGRPTPKPDNREPPAAPSLARFRVVGLPSWQGREDIFVRDSLAGRTQIYAPGDTLASGKIIMIDYRRLPHPKKPELLSPSRVIIRIGVEYWAIELGQTLADKHMLSREQLPEKLKLMTTTAPAAQAMGPGPPKGQ